MEDQVVNLIITVYWMPPIFWLFFFEKLKYLVEVRYRSYRIMCLDIYSFCLCIANCRECGYLPVIESCRLAKVFQPDILWVDSV